MAHGYKQGGNTTDIGQQLNDFHFSKFAVMEASAENTFSRMGSPIQQPKHFGQTFKCYREIPIIHNLNVNSQGIDAFGVSMTQGKWYSWDAAGVRVEHATLDDAKARVGQIRIESGNGNLGGTSRDFLVQQGSIPLLGEEGGIVNQVGMRRAVIEAIIKEYGLTMRFTKRELDLDTQAGLLSKFTKRLAQAYGQMRERQIRNGLLQAGLDNVTYGGSALSQATMDATSVMTYQTLRNMENTLDLDLCPSDSTVLSGSKFVDTLVVPSSRWMFIPYELKNTVEDMLKPDGTSAFQGVEHYTDTATYIPKGEFGRIGRFRFILVHDMPHFAGVGADVDVNDAVPMQSSNGKYSAFPALIVGDDSFSTLGLQGDVAQVITALPKADANKDPYGKNGSVAISWYFGLVVKRPERIKVGMFTAAA